MRHPAHRLDPISRRDFVLRAAHGLLGVSLLPGAFAALGAAEPMPAGGRATSGKAKRVIYLFMGGGMSHLDTFDPKPDNPAIQGPVKTIDTNVAGIRVTENVPLLARHMDKLAVIRSMHHTMGNHEPGEYLMRTGFEHQAGIVHPALGAWVARLGTRRNPQLPQYVRVGGLGGHPVSGFFDVRYSPLPIAKAEDGLANGRRTREFDDERLKRNLELAKRLDADFTQRHARKDVRAYGDYYQEAVDLMSSKDLDAFDLKQEPAATHEAYGGKDNAFGKGLLLARRLVERDVQFVEVDLSGWDTHTQNHRGVAAESRKLDQGLSALLQDLSDRGLLAETLVVVATEFGRTPEIDEALGRGHHPLAFTCLLAGGGIRGGQVVGATDARGERVVGAATSVLDLHATVAHQLGLDPTRTEAPFVGAQKFTIVGKDSGTKGRPIAALV